jgi:peptidyl-Asp metalloendopeptidase
MRNSVTYMLIVASVCCLFSLFPNSGLAQNSSSTFLFKPVPVTKGGGGLTSDQASKVEKLRDLKTTSKLWVADLNSDLLRSKSLTLNVADDTLLDAVTEKIEKRSGNNFTWIGKMPEVSETATSILVVKDGQVTGSVQAGNELYEIVPLGSGRHAILQVDQSKFPPDEGLHPLKAERVHKELKAKYASLDGSESQESYDSDMAEKGDTPVVDALVVYTAAAKAKAGGKAQMEAKIQQAVDETNLSYKNSKINMKLHLAHQFETNFAETGKSKNDLNLFVKRGNSPTDEIFTSREKYRGDVVVLILSKLDDTCGMAAQIEAEPKLAFCIVSLDCMTAMHSFAHEIGHLLGARHNWEADSTESKTFPDRHGFWHRGQGKNKAWRTVMTYPCPTVNCPRILWWSNPEVKIEGVPTGSKGCCNDAAILNARAKIVSKFK